MSDEKRPETGGAAFPMPAEYRGSDGEFVSAPHNGMTLLDYFIAHAPPMPDAKNYQGTAAAHAAWSLDYAEAVMAERKRRGL